MFPTPLLACLGLAALLSTGCSSIPLFSGSSYHKADAKHPVGEVLCVWEAAEGRGLDNLPCRGFGGQILFFGKGYQEPLIVNGDVRVYVFDEQGVDGDSSKPLHQFDFPAAAWNSFLAPSNLGATYQIFIPYTRKGQHGASCTLRIRFTPEGGLPTYSKMATVELGGEGKLARKSPKDTHVITAAGQSKDGNGAGVVTSDWSQLINDPLAVANSVKQPTPGISLGQIQTGPSGNNAMESLRQAAAEASRPEQITPPSLLSEKQKTGHSFQLRSPNSLVGRSLDSEDIPHSAPPETFDSVVPPRKNPRHPLAELESD